MALSKSTEIQIIIKNTKYKQRIICKIGYRDYRICSFHKKHRFKGIEFTVKDRSSLFKLGRTSS